ncbi:MAG: hypothetical protein Tsb0021_14530 [Chlamydiales bacterium]
MKSYMKIGLTTYIAVLSLSLGLDAASYNNQYNGSTKQQNGNMGQSMKKNLPWSSSEQKGSPMDQELAKRVRNALEKGPKDYNEYVDIEVHKGKVVLNGRVSTYEDLEMIEEKINDVGGIISIENYIEVKPDMTPNARWHGRDFDKSQKMRYNGKY